MHASRMIGCSRRWCIAGAIAWLPSAGTAGTLTPGVTFGVHHDEYRASSDSLARRADVRTLAPQLRVRGETPTSALDLLAVRRYEFHPAAPAPGAITGQPFALAPLTSDHSVDDASIRAHTAWSEREGIHIDGRYTRARDLLQFEQGILVPDAVRAQWSGTAWAAAWRTEGSYWVRGWTVATPDTTQAMVQTWSGSFLPLLRRDGAITVSWWERRLEFGSSTALLARAALLGARRRVAQNLVAEISGGPGDVRWADGRQTRGAALVLALRAPGAREGAFTGEVRLQQHLPTSARAALRIPVVPRCALSLEGETALDVEAGIDRRPDLTRRVVVGVADTIARANVVQLEGSIAQLRAIASDGLDATVARASAWLGRRMYRWVTARAGYSYLRQLGSGPGVLDVRRSRLEAQLAIIP